MIHFLRQDNMSITIFFNLLGLEQLIDVFKKALRGEEEPVIARVDMSVVTLKKKSKEMDVTFTIQAGESTQIIRQDNKIIWKFEKEDIVDAIGRFERCKSEGFFPPAEFMYVRVPKNKRLDCIYCELITEEVVP